MADNQQWGLGGRVRRTESGEEEEEEILEEVLSGGKTQDFRLEIRRNLERIPNPVIPFSS